MRLNPCSTDMLTTLFERMSRLARVHDTINLGGADGPEPVDLLEAAARALGERGNQYPPSRGLLELRAAAADFYSRFDRLALMADNVVVTSGATEAITAALTAVITPGDEVIVIELAYDAYRPLIQRLGGVVRAVFLTPPNWRPTLEALEAVVTSRTRALVFNKPLNPSGRAFDRHVVEAAAEVCRRQDLVAVSDEVWGRLVYDNRRHRSVSAASAMFERTLRRRRAGHDKHEPPRSSGAPPRWAGEPGRY